MKFSFLLKILTPVLILSSLGLSAQEVKSFHIDSTGRLFVNPGTPVYLYISTSPEGKDAVRIQSLQPEGEPMYWDGHGYHFLTHLNLYLGRNIRFDIFADGHPPRTSANFDPKVGIQKGSVIYLSGAAEIELTANDPFSGVHSIYYSVNESEYQLYKMPISFEKDGEYIVKFYAIDNVGNKEDVGERTIIIDTTPPVTNLQIDGPQHNDVVASSTRFALNATDALGVRETYYSINDGNELRYTRPIPITALKEGDHSISWYSVDIVGNTEEKQIYNFFVDRTPPMVFEEIMGNTYMVGGREFSSGRSQLRIVAVDNKAGVKEIYYSINNASFQLYEKPIFLSEITGAINIKSYAIDNVNNKGTSGAEGQQFSMPEVDITGPNIAHSFIGSRVTLRDTLWISPKTRINITANDKGSGVDRIEYRKNDGQTQLFSEPFIIEKAGYYKISCTAWDNVENLNIASFSLGVDAKAPEIHYQFSVRPFGHTTEEDKTIQIFPTGVMVYLAATDDIAGVEKIMVSINGSREKVYTQPLSGFKAGQTHSVTLRAIDKLGNENEKSFTFRVE